MKLVETIRNVLGLGRQVRDNAAGVKAAQEAYDAGAGLAGVLIAFSGATPGAADNTFPVAVMEILDGVERTAASSARTLELASQALAQAAQTAAIGATEARELEELVSRLKGSEPLKVVLEGDR